MEPGMPLLRKLAPLALLLALPAALAPAAPAHAATIGVDTFADTLAADSACSLREAIQAANANAQVDTCPAGGASTTIILAAGTYTLTLAGRDEDLNQAGDLDIAAHISIQGADRDATVIDASALGDRVFDIHPGAALALARLSLRHGGSSLADLDGGAIFNRGVLALESTELAYNTAGGDGGAIFNQAGALSIAGSVIRDNTAGLAGQSNGGGGGIFNAGGDTHISESIVNNNSTYNGYGGGISSSHLLAIANSWIHDNTTNSHGGGVYNTATAVITGTVLESNRAGHDGGNLYSGNDEGDSALTVTSSELRAGQARHGGAIFNSGALALSSASLALNSAEVGGALYSVALSATVQLNNDTLAANTHEAAGPGAAITNLGGTLIAGNTLIGQNGAAASCAGPITSAGHNLDSEASCGFSGAGDMSNTAPQLGPLPAVDRTPNTFPLLAGSPAINAGDNASCAALDIFQRARPHGLACDIGAYETNSPPSASAASYATAEDQPLSVAAPGLLLGASDPDGDALRVVAVEWPTRGQLALNADGSFSYTPPANYYGGDQFAYRVSDGALATEVRVASVEVTPQNDPPTARDDSVTTGSAAPLRIAGAALLANDSDIEGDGLAISAVSAQSFGGGAVLLDDGDVRYTPPLGFRGVDSFGYSVSDGNGGAAGATVRVGVRVSWLFVPVARR